MLHANVADVPLTGHPWRYDHERRRMPYLTTEFRAIPVVASFVRNRAFWPPPIKEVVRFDTGRPRPVGPVPPEAMLPA